MKNATRYCAASPAYYRMCSTDVYCSKQTGSSSTKGNHHPSFLRFWNWAEENCRCSQNLWRRRKMLLKQKPSKTFVNGLLGFITLGIYTPLEARVLLTIIVAWVAHRYGQLYLHCSLIYFWVPSSCFLHSDQPLSEGEIIPFSGVCQSGEAALSTRRRRWRLHALTDRLLIKNWRRPAATSSRSTSFSALASANSSVYFASSAATSLTHLHVSNCRVLPASVLWHFCRAGLCR